MKGIVFTEFLEMVEDRFSPDMADQIIEQADLPSGGAYTAVGTYDHAEIVALVVQLSAETKMSLDALLYAFGEHLFTRFVAGFPHFFEEKSDAFRFLQNVDNYIHVEVKKLYPDAELPSISTEVKDDQHLTLIYKSDRGMADLAHGLIVGCINHFAEAITVEPRDLADQPGRHVEFELTRAA
ncbi:MAG: heme NO-binding domain-containing protein [Alphaproteobacteria bacterium]